MRIVKVMALILLVTVIFCGRKQTQKPTVDPTAAPAKLLEYGNKFFQEGDYENAYIAYRLIYTDYPTSREYIDAVIGLARCYGKFDKYDQQFELLYNLLRENLIPSRVPDIYNAIAEFYENSAGVSAQLTGDDSLDYMHAIEYYQKAVEYPNSQDSLAKGYAQYKIGTLYEKLRNYPKAIEAYQNAMNFYGHTEWGARAEEALTDLKTRLQMRLEYEQSGSITAKPDTSAASQAAPTPEDHPDRPLMTPAEGDTAQAMPAMEHPKADTTATRGNMPAPADTTKKMMEHPVPPPSTTDTTTAVPDTLDKPKLDIK